MPTGPGQFNFRWMDYWNNTVFNTDKADIHGTFDNTALIERKKPLRCS